MSNTDRAISFGCLEVPFVFRYTHTAKPNVKTRRREKVKEGSKLTIGASPRSQPKRSSENINPHCCLAATEQPHGPGARTDRCTLNQLTPPALHPSRFATRSQCEIIKRNGDPADGAKLEVSIRLFPLELFSTKALCKDVGI